MAEQSLKKRYAAKLFANFIGLAIGLLISIIVPRGLGPQSYGDYNFLSAFFLSLIGFLTLSTESGFFVKLSQRPNDLKLISFYLRFNIVAIVAMFIIILLSQLLNISGKIWIDQSIRFVYLGAIGGSLLWLVQIVTYIMDAYALTVTSEILRVIQKLLGVVAIIILFYLDKITLSSYFIFNYCLAFFLILGSGWVLIKKGIAFNNWKLEPEDVRNYTNEFYDFSKPIFMVSLFGIIATLFERWLLQKYGGSVQQGFYGLSYQIGSVCILFTSAMSSLMMREFAISFKKNDLSTMSSMFRRYVPFLYTVAAFFACFICIQAENVTLIFGGKEFQNAALPVMIMALYPVHQTYGQLNSTIFLATGQTRLYSIISLIFYILGLPAVVILIIFAQKIGLESSSTGMALKMVAIQFFSVNAQLFFHSRYLKLSFYKYFLHQIISVLFLLVVAYSSKLFTNNLSMVDGTLINVLVSGFIYSLMVLIAILILPAIFGLRKGDVHILVSEIRKRLISK